MPVSKRHRVSTNGHSLAAKIVAASSTPPSPPERKNQTVFGPANLLANGKDGKDGKDGRDTQVRSAGLLGKVYGYLADYIAAPLPNLVAMSTWVMSAYMVDIWDRFPHLGIYSPEKRCGKTLLLELLEMICPGGMTTTNISGASLFRRIATEKMTLLLDEAQSLNRRGSESSEVLNDMFCGSISKGAKVTRCTGPKHTSTDFPIYCPKVFAHIGQIDGVLGDRCLPQLLERVTKEERGKLFLKKYRYRAVTSRAADLSQELREWAEGETNQQEVMRAYDGESGEGIEPFDVDNERLADLLTPLQSVLTVSKHSAFLLSILKEYAEKVDEQAARAECQTDGVRLLVACKDIFSNAVIDGLSGGPPWDFIGTDMLIALLVERSEEQWATYRRDKPITRESLANLLRPYGIKSEFNKERTAKYYYASRFKSAWNRYCPLPTLENPSILSNPSNLSEAGQTSIQPNNYPNEWMEELERMEGKTRNGARNGGTHDDLH